MYYLTLCWVLYSEALLRIILENYAIIFLFFLINRHIDDIRSTCVDEILCERNVYLINKLVSVWTWTNCLFIILSWTSQRLTKRYYKNYRIVFYVQMWINVHAFHYRTNANYKSYKQPNVSTEKHHLIFSL